MTDCARWGSSCEPDVLGLRRAVPVVQGIGSWLALRTLRRIRRRPRPTAAQLISYPQPDRRPAHDSTPHRNRGLPARRSGSQAGHAVASVILGPGIERAMLTPNNRHHAGFTEHNRLDALGLHPLITAAGPMAEARHQFGPRPTQQQMSALLDVNSHDYATQRTSGTPSPTDAAPLLEGCWPAVVELAQVLDQRGEVYEEDVIRALRIPPGRAGDRYVAQLRSRYRAVS